MKLKDKVALITGGGRGISDESKNVTGKTPSSASRLRKKKSRNDAKGHELRLRKVPRPRPRPGSAEGGRNEILVNFYTLRPLQSPACHRRLDMAGRLRHCVKIF